MNHVCGCDAFEPDPTSSIAKDSTARGGVRGAAKEAGRWIPHQSVGAYDRPVKPASRVGCNGGGNMTFTEALIYVKYCHYILIGLQVAIPLRANLGEVLVFVTCCCFAAPARLGFPRSALCFGLVLQSC